MSIWTEISKPCFKMQYPTIFWRLLGLVPLKYKINNKSQTKKKKKNNICRCSTVLAVSLTGAMTHQIKPVLILGHNPTFERYWYRFSTEMLMAAISDKTRNYMQVAIVLTNLIVISQKINCYNICLQFPHSLCD